MRYRRAVGYCHVSRIAIVVPAAHIFDFVTDVANWPALHPASRRVALAHKQGPLSLGDEFEESVAAAGRTRRMRWVVTACDRPRAWTVRGHAIAGPAFMSEIRYQLAPRGDATDFVRELVYTFTHPVLRLLHAVYVQRKIARESVRSLENVKRCASAAHIDRRR